MTRTTPPRPYDLLALFPELAAYGKPAVRLHPRRGEPTADESSIGGPLLWPADEPWPACGLDHEDSFDEPYAYTLAWRAYPEDRDRREKKGALDWDVERRRAEDLEAQFTAEDNDEPPPLIPVAQLYYREVPHLPWPERYDLLQVLWCPRNHPEAETPFNPVFQLRWRRAETIGPRLAEPPVPPTCYEAYVPSRCVVHPETITEYPNTEDLPAELAEAIDAWAARIGNDTAYNWDTAAAPGWKTTGYGGVWGIIDFYPILCDCGERQLPLLTTDTTEFDSGTKNWQPIEEHDTAWEFAAPVKVVLGRGYTLQLYYCPASEDHPNRTEMF
jgi:hypothetical protein